MEFGFYAQRANAVTDQQLTSCLLAIDSNQSLTTNFFSAPHLDTDASTRKHSNTIQYDTKVIVYS